MLATITGTVAGVFPNPEALLRCAGAVLIEAMPSGKSSSTDASFGSVRLSRHRLVLSVWGIGLGHDCAVRPDGGKPCPAEGNWPRLGGRMGNRLIFWGMFVCLALLAVEVSLLAVTGSWFALVVMLAAVGGVVAAIYLKVRQVNRSGGPHPIARLDWAEGMSRGRPNGSSGPVPEED